MSSREPEWNAAVNETLDESWYQYFASDDDQSVNPTGMTLAASGHVVVVVVGSTKGSGGVFGDKEGTDTGRIHPQARHKKRAAD